MVTVRCAFCGAEAEVPSTAPGDLPKRWVELRWHDAGSVLYIVWRACSPAHAQRIMKARGEDMGHGPPA